MKKRSRWDKFKQEVTEFLLEYFDVFVLPVTKILLWVAVALILVFAAFVVTSWLLMSV